KLRVQRQVEELVKLFPAPPRIPHLFKTRGDFASDDDYGNYVKNTLKVGMRVRCITDYEKVKRGMTGTYYARNGTPPCLVCWDKDIDSVSSLVDPFPRDKARHAYWVYWHQIEIIGESGGRP